MTDRGSTTQAIVLFDLDDTILDFKKAEFVAISETFSLLGIEPTESVVSRYSEINQRLWEQLEEGLVTRDQVLFGRFDQLFAELGVKASKIKAKKIYERELALGYFFMQGSAAMIKSLFGSYRLFICTNGISSVQRGRIDGSGIAPYFEDVFISEEIKENKPTKEFFEACFQRIPGFQRERTIMVGDSLTSDIRGGINAGVKTCWFNPKEKPFSGQYKPDYEISSLDMLAPLLRELF